MVNLLLLLLFMVTTKETSIELQPVQQPPVISTPVVEFGRTTRPLNARTATNNRYLDGIIAYKSSQTIPDVTLTDITGYTFTKTGAYVFENTNSIKIPVDGTYIINAVFDWNDAITQGLHYVTINGTQSLIQVGDNMSAFQNIFITGVENLSKGDIIATEVFQESGASKNVTVKLTITKIS